MIWLAGGHFDQGSAEDLLYDAEFVVNASQVIIVEPNYRLGALGWLKTFDIDSNLGLYDQRLAFRWTIDNIAKFGGDPNEITIFGQSAGATSTASHLVSLGSREFNIKRAILESNPWGLPLKTTKEAEAVGDRFLQITKCLVKGKKCLKALTVDQILDAQQKAEDLLPIFHPVELFYPFTPIVDGIDIIENPLQAFIQGNFSLDVSIMSGSVTNESLIFIYEAFPSPVSPEEYHALLDVLWRGHGKQIAEQYPVNVFDKDTRPMLSILATDALFTCPQRAAARGVSQYSQNPSYMYYYNHSLSFSQAFGPNYTVCQAPGIVCHASELPIVFHSAQDANYTYTAEELVLTEQMGFYWTNMAISGNPNKPQPVGLEWPVYTASSSISMQLNTPVFTETFIFKQKCDFWDSIGYFNDV
jgi:carboxylesterase type B